MLKAAALILLVLGFAEPSMAQDADERLLSPAELRAAVADRVVCLQVSKDNTCSGGVLFFENITDTTARAREVVTVPLATLASGGQADLARQMQRYDDFADTFRRIDELSRQNNFPFLRLVDARDYTFDATKGAWCEGPGSPIAVLDFYLTNSTSLDEAADLPLPDDLNRQVRVFLMAFLTDERVRAFLRDVPDRLAWADSQLGANPLCAQRYGRDDGAGLTLTSTRFVSTDGVALPGLDSHVSVLDPASIVLDVR